MKTFREYINEQLIAEAYKFENGQDVINAIENNKVGVKILPEYKKLNGNTESFVRRNFDIFFKKCKELNIKDIAFGVQFLLSRISDINLDNAVKNDAIYEFLKSRNKPWVKELPEYKDFINSSYNKTIWHNFEKAVQSEQSNHGKINKGTGNLKDVNVLYNNGNWKLMSVTTFEGAKAASFYSENGKEIPTSWCTRADKYYFNNYTKNGEYPLYIFRNLKNGNAYQMAFTDDDSVHFLDHNDENGDEITQGDFSKIPDDLLKLVKDPRPATDGSTLLDYKKYYNKIKKLPERKNYVLQTNSSDGSFSTAKLGKEVSLENGVVKRDFLNYTEEQQVSILRQYFKTNNFSNSKKINSDNLYMKKIKATVYYLKDKPESKWAYYTTKDDNKKTVLSYSIAQKNWDYLTREEQEKIEAAANKDFGYDKLNKRTKEKEDYYKNRIENYNKKYITEPREIAKEISKKIDFSKSKIFSEVLYFNSPNFKENVKYTDEVPQVSGDNLIKKIYLSLKPSFIKANKIKEKSTTVKFIKKLEPYQKEKIMKLDSSGYFDKQGFDESSFDKTDYTNSGWAIIDLLVDEESYDYVSYILPKNEYEFVKYVAREIQKIIIKDKDFKILNSLRRSKHNNGVYESFNYFNY